MRVLVVLLLLILANLQYQLWVGEGALATLWDLERSITTQAEENATLSARNQRLAAEVADLKTGLQTVEAAARRDLGMVGRGETFFHLVSN